MLRYILQRLFLIPVLLFVFSVMVFALVQAPPGDYPDQLHCHDYLLPVPPSTRKKLNA